VQEQRAVLSDVACRGRRWIEIEVASVDGLGAGEGIRTECRESTGGADIVRFACDIPARIDRTDRTAGRARTSDPPLNQPRVNGDNRISI
jgi:hypothetical protein